MSRHFPSAELVLAWFCGLSSRPRVLSLDRCGASGANGNSGDAVSRDEVGFVGTIWRGMHVRDAAGYLFDSWITWWSVRNSIHRLVICVFPVVNDHHLDWNVDDISCQMMNIYIISYLCWDGGITPLISQAFHQKGRWARKSSSHFCCWWKLPGDLPFVFYTFLPDIWSH